MERFFVPVFGKDLGGRKVTEGGCVAGSGLGRWAGVDCSGLSCPGCEFAFVCVELGKGC